MFASFKSGDRRRGTAILRAETPMGPFIPWSLGPVTPDAWECLDGTFYVDRGGNPWMVFCHEWVQAGDGEVLAMPLTMDLRAAAGEPRLLFRASEAEWTKEMAHSSGIRGRVTDGPFLWWEDEWTRWEMHQREGKYSRELSGIVCLGGCPGIMVFCVVFSWS